VRRIAEYLALQIAHDAIDLTIADFAPAVNALGE
jgi:hypothetical protein